VYDTIGYPTVTEVFNGYSSTILCYGQVSCLRPGMKEPIDVDDCVVLCCGVEQTGSGKTHTIFGKCGRWSKDCVDMYGDRSVSCAVGNA
jgi:hypothetical protein